MTKIVFHSALSALVSRPLLILLAIFFLAMVVRSVPLHFDGMFDPDSHFHARMSNEIARTHEIISWDPLSLQGRVYSYPPLLHILVGFISSVTRTDALLVLKVFGVLVGAGVVLSTFLLARLFSNSYSVALWSAFFSGLSSILVFRTAAHTRPDGLAILFIPFLLYLWLSRRDAWAFILSLSLVVLHPLSAVVYAIFLSAWLGWGVLRKVSFPALLPLALVGMALVFFAWVFSVGLPLSEYGSKLSLEASELAPLAVVSFVLFFPLAWAFVLVSMSQEKLPLLLLTWLGVGIALGSVGVRFAMYFIPFFSIVAGFGIRWVFSKLVSDKRTLPVFLVLFLVAGCVTVYSIMDGIRPYVHASEKPALDFLRTHGRSSDAILSAWDQGHVLTYYTQKPVVIDGYFEFGHELAERNDAWRNAFASSTCSTILHSVDQFSAHFVYVSRDELLSTTTKTGLLELDDCPGLSLVFSSDGARVYERNTPERAVLSVSGN